MTRIRDVIGIRLDVWTNADIYGVNDWRKGQYVALTLDNDRKGMYVAINDPATIDELIQALQEAKREAWPQFRFL